MKKLFFGIALALFAPTLFSFVGNNNNTVTPAPRSVVKSVISDEKPKKGKKAKKDKAKLACNYWFQVTNTVSLTENCNTIILSKSAPQTTPPSTLQCDGVPINYCFLGYPNFVIINGEYFPSLDGINVASPCNYECKTDRSN